MDGVQLSQGCRATTRRQFTFYHTGGGEKCLRAVDIVRMDRC